MYQFTTTTIINSSKDSNGTTDKYTGTSTALNVTRVGKFLKDNIVSIYKRPYAAGVKEIAQVTIPTVTSGKVIRVTADIRLSQSTNSEYANYKLYFAKPVEVEVIATGTAATDATAIKNQFNELLGRFGFAYVTATTNSANLILTATDNYQRINSIKVEKELASYNSVIQPEYEDITAGTFSVTTAGKVGFGDDAYMIGSIMFPTYENTRHFGTNKEERPILGGNYTQYTLRYKVAKTDDGIVAPGDSITTHVFYVKSDLVSGFESAIASVGLTVPATMQAVYTATDGILSTGADETDQIVVTGAIGAVTYSTTDSTKIAVGASTGLVTTAGKTATGAAVVTVTDAVGATDTVTYDIQA